MTDPNQDKESLNFDQQQRDLVDIAKQKVEKRLNDSDVVYFVFFPGLATKDELRPIAETTTDREWEEVIAAIKKKGAQKSK